MTETQQPSPAAPTAVATPRNTAWEGPNTLALVDVDPLACRVRWHAAGCCVVTYSDGVVRHEARG